MLTVEVDFSEEAEGNYDRHRTYPKGNARTVYHDPITKKSYERRCFQRGWSGYYRYIIDYVER